MNRLFSARQMILPAPVSAMAARIALRWRGSALQSAWRWWLAELRACMPEQLQRLMVRDAAERLHLWPFTAPVPEMPTTVQHVLLLPPSAVMVQTLQMPLAAARDLHTVVGYELDRLTPFDRSQLYFVARQEHRRGAVIDVILVAILRERLDAILDQCAAQSLRPSMVDVGLDQKSRLNVDLLPASQRPRLPRNNRGLRGKLIWLCLGLLAVAMLLWLNDRQRLLAQMEQTVQAQKSQVAQIQAIRQQLANTLGAANYLIERKSKHPPLVTLLAELTTCLPSDTWIEQLEINGLGEVSFSGQSAKASALIARIKECHSLVNARFQGVIQPDVQTGKDHFSLNAEMRQEAANAPTTHQP